MKVQSFQISEWIKITMVSAFQILSDKNICATLARSHGTLQIFEFKLELLFIVSPAGICEDDGSSGEHSKSSYSFLWWSQFIAEQELIRVQQFERQRRHWRCLELLLHTSYTTLQSGDINRPNKRNWGRLWLWSTATRLPSSRWHSRRNFRQHQNLQRCELSGYQRLHVGSTGRSSQNTTAETRVQVRGTPHWPTDCHRNFWFFKNRKRWSDWSFPVFLSSWGEFRFKRL